MFLERRKHNGHKKFFLMHSYREEGKTKKVRVYVGRKLNKLQLSKKLPVAQKVMEKRLSSLRKSSLES